MSPPKRRKLNATDAGTELCDMEKKILQYFQRNSHMKTHETLKIAKGIGMKTKSDVNSTLYSLQKRGIIVKVVDIPPTWKLVNSQQECPTSSQASTSYLSQSVAQRIQASVPFYTEPSLPMSNSFADTKTESRVKEFTIPPSPMTIMQREKIYREQTALGPYYDGNIKQGILRLLNDHEYKHVNDIYKSLGYDLNNINEALHQLGIENRVVKQADTFKLNLNTRQGNNLAFNMDFTKDIYSKTFKIGATFPETIPKTFAEVPTSGEPANSIHNTELNIPMGKNAISVINEYAQRCKMLLKYEESMSGPDHMKTFRTRLILGNQPFSFVTASSKKEAKLKAAESALAQLQGNGKFRLPTGMEGPVYSTANCEMSVHDNVAMLICQKYNNLMVLLPEPISGRKIIAGIVMSTATDKKYEVISIGSGNRCVAGDKLSLRGETVNDCHAEVIARRGFVRFLYKKLLEMNENSQSDIFESVPDKPTRFRIIDGIEFHLYINTAPCGDSAIFSPSDPATDTDQDNGHSGQHHPLFENKKQGILRTKVENGEGCIPLEDDDVVPTWDGILRGERLRTMSCSDKIAKWNYLGLQGSLLSRFIDPIYLSTLTLGMLYNHGHLTRAVCCRVEKYISTSTETSDPQYRVNHPVVAKVSGQDPNRGTGKMKTKEFSVNWCLGDSDVEVLDGTEGKGEQRFNTKHLSRVCKAKLCTEFIKVCRKFQCQKYVCDSYRHTKMGAARYQEAKDFFYKSFYENGCGKWMQKPKEEKEFEIPSF